jgi:hypothetical protein
MCKVESFIETVRDDSFHAYHYLRTQFQSGTPARQTIPVRLPPKCTDNKNRDKEANGNRKLQRGIGRVSYANLQVNDGSRRQKRIRPQAIKVIAWIRQRPFKAKLKERSRGADSECNWYISILDRDGRRRRRNIYDRLEGSAVGC